jgi:hypothetical protein
MLWGRVNALVWAMACAACVAVAVSDTAIAQVPVRVAHADDPQDQRPSLDPSGPRSADVKAVDVTYDAAGSLAIMLTFWSPLNPNMVGDGVVVEISQTPHPELDADLACSSSDSTGDVVVFSNTVQPTPGADDRPSIAVTGYDGQVTGAVDYGADGTTLTYRVAAPAIANRGYRCVHARTVPGGHVSLGDIDDVPYFYFAGFTPQPKALPTLSKAQAIVYMKQSLLDDFGGLFRQRIAQRFAYPCNRRSLTRLRCDVGWGVGDFFFLGTETIWYSRKGAEVEWNYAYRIKRYDDYCARVRHGKHCTRIYRVK